MFFGLYSNLNLVVVETKGAKVVQPLEGLRGHGLQLVVRQVEHVEVAVVGKDGRGHAGQLVASQPGRIDR